MNALPPGDGAQPGDAPEPERFGWQPAADPDEALAMLADAYQGARDRAAGRHLPTGAELIALLDEEQPDATPLGSGLLWTVAGDDTVPDRRASDHVAPTLAQLLGRAADLVDTRAAGPDVPAHPPVLVQFSSRLLTGETTEVKQLAHHLLDRGPRHGVTLDVTRPADELLLVDGVAALRDDLGDTAPDGYDSGMSALVTRLIQESVEQGEELWIVAGDFGGAATHAAGLQAADFGELLREAQRLVDARRAHDWTDTDPDMKKVHVAFSLAVLGNSTPADRDALVTLSTQAVFAQVILRPVVSVRPTGTAEEGELTDTWSVTSRGVELARVEATTIEEAGRKARTYPQVHAADQAEGGISLRRLRTNELGKGTGVHGDVDPTTAFRPIDLTRPVLDQLRSPGRDDERPGETA
ncbi:hypothetical protein [Saccharothrix sp. HUAS TT1]|uniref:hypothetical protein n=1 Tax=unclassified Saccharothrix TaxID=2593673 RepID=UPI00345B7966